MSHSAIRGVPTAVKSVINHFIFINLSLVRFLGINMVFPDLKVAPQPQKLPNLAKNHQKWSVACSVSGCVSSSELDLQDLFWLHAKKQALATDHGPNVLFFESQLFKRHATRVRLKNHFSISLARDEFWWNRLAFCAMLVGHVTKILAGRVFVTVFYFT